MYQLPHFFSENFENLDYKTLKLMYDEAEKRLSETIKIFEDSTQKSYRLLTIVISYLTVAVTFLINEIKGPTELSYLLKPSILLIIILLYSLYFLVRGIWTSRVCVTGTSPSKSLVSDFFVGLPRELQEKNYILSQLVDFENRIQSNRELNNLRLERLDFVIILLMITPLTLIASFFC